VSRVSTLPKRELSAQAEALDDFAVTLDVLVADVIEKRAALIDQFDQTAAGVMILLVLMEVASEVFDSRAKQRDLNLWRTRITAGELMFGNNLLFLFCAQGHVYSFSVNVDWRSGFSRKPSQGTTRGRWSWALCKSPDHRLIKLAIISVNNCRSQHQPEGVLAQSSNVPFPQS